MKKITITCVCILSSVMILCLTAIAAYWHKWETDTPEFLEAYSSCEGTKLDSCALCHTGGEYEKNPGEWVAVGSCQWCHREEIYGYDGTGDANLTMSSYGRDYRDYGRNEGAFPLIEDLDSDGDGYTNKQEIDSLHYPGDPNDDPTKVAAPRITYSMSDIEALPQHKQFLLMNTHRRGDWYAEYEGVIMGDLLLDAGILDSATSITVFAPDGFFYTYDLYPGRDYYYVYGMYPQAQFHYEEQADEAMGGWCDYSAPSCIGRNNGDLITVEGGLKLLFAYKRDGAFLMKGYLDETNRLCYDCEGPFRAVPPQMVPSTPDQSVTHWNQNVCWPFDENIDHNCGFSCRTVVAIRVEPLPEGTTDFNWYEGGWDYVDNEEVIVYGAIKSGNLTGKVTDRDTGEPVSGCKVTTDKWGYAVLTDSKGDYSLTGIKPDTYTLMASAIGYDLTTSTVVVVTEGGTARQNLTLVSTAGGLWSAATDLGDGWKYLDWFGFFWVDETSPWIYHADHGRAYTYGEETSSIWFYTLGKGWIWTADSIYPWVYVLEVGSWDVWN
ncbi:MAG: GEGP motif-containing diheme protein [Thermodesulfobacteriota bacterium]|nr:GEGP motif-containing diheme protein [Thermodesulfobacteriota bacterium]